MLLLHLIVLLEQSCWAVWRICIPLTEVEGKLLRRMVCYAGAVECLLCYWKTVQKQCCSTERRAQQATQHASFSTAQCRQNEQQLQGKNLTLTLPADTAVLVDFIFCLQICNMFISNHCFRCIGVGF